MDLIRIVEFDIHANNPVNTIPGEKIPLKDKTLNWLIPNGAPFYAIPEKFNLYNQDGMRLTRGRDYFWEGEFVPFCHVSGKDVVSFIRISDEILANNDFVTVDYQSMGAFFVPRNDLEEWMLQITNGKVPVPWSKVFGVPPTLPSAFHKHSAQTEIGDWFELTWFWAYMAELQQDVDPTLNDTITEQVDAAFARLNQLKDQYMTLLANHDRNYHAPHLTDKFDVDLGNVDNFRTATLAEDRAGLLNNVFSTARGVQELAKAFIPDTSAAMRSGVMAISRFGGDSFMPPLISGSFEGLGSNSEVTGACLEPTGQVMILGNHFDGRVDGLYFTVIENHRAAAPKITYTGYQYSPPDLESRNFKPNRIIGGSGNVGIMVGVDGTNDWYVALTNGTFNPSAHRYAKCDMSAVRGLQGLATWTTHETATLLDGGEYLLLMTDVGNWQVGERYAFFRIKKADVRSQIDVAWELIKLTYTDYDGASYTNVNYLQQFTHVLSGGALARSGPWSFRQPATGWYRTGKPQAWSMEASGGAITLHTMFCYVCTRDGAGIVVISDMQYSFNPATGTVTIVNVPEALDMGFTDTTPAQRTAYVQDRYATFRRIGSTGLVQYTFLPDGTGIVPYPYNSNFFPLFMFRVTFPGYTRLKDILARPLSMQSIGGQNNISDLVNIAKLPTVSGVYPSSVLYETDGEMYNAVDPLDNQNKTFIRKVTGDYEVRPSVTNLDLPSVKARPLTNDIYTTNLVPGDGIVACTGTAAQLAAGGVESGSLCLSSLQWTSTPGYSWAPYTTALRAPTVNGLVASFPRTYSRTLNTVTRTATYKGDTFYGLRQAALDAIKAFIPSAYRDSTPAWCFTLQVLDELNGGMFHSLNMAVITIHYYNVSAAQIRAQIVLVRLVTEAPGGDHPSAYLITGFTVLDNPPDLRTLDGAATVGQDFWMNSLLRNKPALNCYRDEGRLKCYNTGSFGGIHSSTSRYRAQVFFDINLSTLKFENIAQESQGWNVESAAVFLPKIGMTDINLTYNSRETYLTVRPQPLPFAHTGGAAAIYKKGTDYYMTASAYPESGWVIYFPEDIPLMINGTMYAMPGGTIDLRDVSANPANKIYYVYASVEDDDPRYIISAAELRRSSNLLHVATITTNNQQILTIERLQPFVIGDFELSFTRKGGTIPVSAGLPQDEGVFAFLRSAELLP